MAKRTVEESIEYFTRLANEFERRAARIENVADSGAAAAAKWLTGGNMDANASYWANVERAVDLVKGGELR